jgi:predicted MFS family arabinose efflux permease
MQTKSSIVDGAKIENSVTEKRNFYWLLLTIFAPFALGHFLSFFFRSVNAVLTPHLLKELPLTVGEVGLLSSAYFLAFALGQLPVGLCLDRYGPKRLQMVLLCVAAIGTVLFAFGETFATLFAARVLTGAGLSACFMSAVKAISMSFDRHKIPSLNGAMIAVGGLGAMASTLPVEWVLGQISWRTLFLALGGLALVIALCIAFAVPPQREAVTAAERPSLASLIDVYRDPTFRRTISLVLLPHIVAFGVQGLWISQWLRDVGRLDEVRTAWVLFASMSGIVVGSLSVGAIGEWASKRGIALLDVAGLGVIVFILVQIGAMLNIAPLLPVIAVAFTLTGTIGGIEIAIVAQSVPTHLTGRAATCLNLLIFVGSFLVQTGFGYVLSLWPLTARQGYPPIAYSVAFGFLIALQIPGLWLWHRRKLDGRMMTGPAD